MTSPALDFVKSLKWIDYLYFALVEPRRLAVRIADEASKPLGGGVAVALAAALSELLAASLLVVNTPFFYYKISYGLLLMFMLYLARALATAGLIDMLCQFLGHKGSMSALISLALYALFPQVFMLPLVYIVKVIGFAPPFFYAVFSIGLFIWSALIAVSGISEIHSMAFSRSALIFIFPYAFVALAAFLASLLTVFCVYGYIATL